MFENQSNIFTENKRTEAVDILFCFCKSTFPTIILNPLA